MTTGHALPGGDEMTDCMEAILIQGQASMESGAHDPAYRGVWPGRGSEVGGHRHTPGTTGQVDDVSREVAAAPSVDACAGAPALQGRQPLRGYALAAPCTTAICYL